MKQTAVFLLTGLFCLLLLGCGGDTAVSTPIPLAQLATETASHTPSPSPTETTTPAPTVTQTTTPTDTPNPTVTATPIKYEIPTWVADPNTNVILLESFLSSNIDTVTVSLFNATTGERFDLLTSEEFSYLRWVQQNGQLFISLNYLQSKGAINRDAYQELINITTGDLTTPISDTLPGLKVESPNGRYLTRIIKVPGASDFVITLDRETGEEIELADPFENRYRSNTQAKWSPDSKYLAVNRVSHPDSGPYEYGLTIYLPTGEIFRQYEGLPTIIQWAPNSSAQILYWRGEGENRTPCILAVIEDSTRCLDRVIEWTRQQNVKFGFFSWSFDGTKVGFSHWNTGTANNGLCFISLLDEDIQCPVVSEDLQLEYPVYPYFHYGSPDGQYVALVTNSANPEDAIEPYFTWLTVVNSDGTNFRAFDRVFRPSFSDEIWRPPINP